MPTDIETRRLNDHTNVSAANYDEELILDSSTYGTRNITIENLTNQILGDNNISAIGDGTPTGAIVELDEKATRTDDKMGNTSIAGYADGTVTGILANFATVDVLIPANGWSNVAPYTNTTRVNGVTALDKIICIGYVPSDTPSQNILISHAASKVDYGVTGENTITWYALELKPDIDFRLTIMKGY